MTNSTIKLLQENIKKYRLIKGFTQEKLSEICGIFCDYFSEIERGKKTPSLKRFLIIAEKLEVLPQKFFE